MLFRPLHDWVLIKRSKAAEMTGSGIIIPDSAKDKPAEGIVEAVGPGRYKEEEGKKEKGKKEKKFFPTVLKPGQKVMFVDYMAKDVELDGMEITLVREDDVLGTFAQGGELTVKKQYAVEIKKERPPMVQAAPEKTVAKDKGKKAVKTRAKAAAKVGAAADIKKPSKPKKEKTAAKKAQKTTAKKAAPAKKATPVRKSKPAKKAAVKKTAAKKSGPKKGPIKKALPKKTAAKKVSAKKSPVKKAVPKKTVPKKVSPKKPVKKTKK